MEKYSQGIASLPCAKIQGSAELVRIKAAEPGLWRQRRIGMPNALAASPEFEIDWDEATEHRLRITAELLGVKGRTCSADNYIGYIDRVAEIVVTECANEGRHSCICTLDLQASILVQRLSLFIFFKPSISIDSIDLWSMLEGGRFLEEMKPEAVDVAQVVVIPESAAAVSTTRYIENRQAVKTVHSLFVLIAFGGNAAFLLFVFWFSRF